MTAFSEYVLDRKYTRNVSAKTLSWYDDVWWRAFGPFLDLADIRGSLRTGTRHLLEKGIKPVSVNSWLTGIRAYVLWLHKEGQLKEKPRVELLKCEQTIIQTLNQEQATEVISYKPVGTNQARAHMAACVMLDSGLRLVETLALSKKQVDLDNLIIRVKGKGNKERLVPMSLELRKCSTGGW